LLPNNYYWNAINNSLPYDKRLCMQNLWIRGRELGVKEPKSFFAELDQICTDTLEKTKALEALVSLHY